LRCIRYVFRSKTRLSAIGNKHASPTRQTPIAIAEREHRPPPRLDLVWTGPEARGTTARDTHVLGQELFESACVNVLAAGFRFDHGATLFKPLHQKMQRGLTSTFLVDIEGDNKPIHDQRAYAERAIDRFIPHNWPFGPPLPAIYYDPQSAAAGPPWVSLHAKCIVIEEVTLLVTSANFTDRGQRVTSRSASVLRTTPLPNGWRRSGMR
jgi:hypothetical protein